MPTATSATRTTDPASLPAGAGLRHFTGRKLGPFNGLDLARGPGDKVVDVQIRSAWH